MLPSSVAKSIFSTPSFLAKNIVDSCGLSEYQTNWSATAGRHLRRLMQDQNIPVVTMASRLNVSRAKLTKILNGNSADINLAASCMVALGGQVAELMNPDSIPPIIKHTGVGRIDEMLRDIYNDQSITGLIGLGRYVTADYRCCNVDYEMGSSPSNTEERLLFDNMEQCTSVATHGIVMCGFDFETEKAVTKIGAQKEGVTSVTLQVKNVAITSNKSVSVAYTRFKEVAGEGASAHSTETRMVSLSDRLELSNTIEQIMAGHALRIHRKTWTNHNTIFYYGQKTK